MPLLVEFCPKPVGRCKDVNAEQFWKQPIKLEFILFAFCPKPAPSVSDIKELQFAKHAPMVSAFCPKPAGSVRDVKFLQAEKQKSSDVAFCPKPAGKSNDVAYSQRKKQYVKSTMASMSTTIVFGTIMLASVSHVKATFWFVGTGSVDICSTSAGMSVNFVPSGTSTPFDAIAVFSAACAFFTF